MCVCDRGRGERGSLLVSAEMHITSEPVRVMPVSNKGNRQSSSYGLPGQSIIRKAVPYIALSAAFICSTTMLRTNVNVFYHNTPLESFSSSFALSFRSISSRFSLLVRTLAPCFSISSKGFWRGGRWGMLSIFVSSDCNDKSWTTGIYPVDRNAIVLPGEEKLLSEETGIPYIPLFTPSKQQKIQDSFDTARTA